MSTCSAAGSRGLDAAARGGLAAGVAIAVGTQAYAAAPASAGAPVNLTIRVAESFNFLAALPASATATLAADKFAKQSYGGTYGGGSWTTGTMAPSGGSYYSTGGGGYPTPPPPVSSGYVHYYHTQVYVDSQGNPVRPPPRPPAGPPSEALIGSAPDVATGPIIGSPSVPVGCGAGGPPVVAVSALALGATAFLRRRRKP